MVDREARTRLIEVTESYLNGEITTSQFDDELCGIDMDTCDPTVEEAVYILSSSYSDFELHIPRVRLTKEDWDDIQRLLLLLHSDAHLHVKHRLAWSWRQPIAALTLLVFVAVAYRLGLGEHLFTLAIPFGLVAILLGKGQSQPPEDEIRRSTTLAPFASVAQLLAVHRRTPEFRKKPYPPKLGRASIWDACGERAIGACHIGLSLILSPLVLLRQSFPGVWQEVTVACP